MKRLLMKESHRAVLEFGAVVDYLAGRIYHIEEELAQALLAAGKAVEADAVAEAPAADAPAESQK